MLWGAAVALAVAGLVATLARPVAPGVPADLVTDLTAFRPDVLARVDAWVGPIRLAFLPRTLVELATPVVLFGTGTGRRLLERLAGRRLRTLRAAGATVLATTLTGLPFTVWLGYVHAGRVGLRTSGPVRWSLELLGEALLRAGLVAVGVAVALWLVRRLPRAWPPVVTLVATAAAVGLLLVEPVVTTQLRLAPVPLQDGPVAQAVDEVLTSSTLDDVAVVVGAASVRTSAVNAYVTGTGPTRTVVLFDTLLELPPEQVAAVVAHEVAHAEVADPLRGVLATASAVLPLALLGAWVLRRRPLPLHGSTAGAGAVALLLVVQLVGAPIATWQSRRVEAAADARALELRPDPGQAVRVARGFVVGSLSDPTPPAWVVALGGTHPSPDQRIRRAVALARAQGLSLPTLATVRAEEDARMLARTGGTAGTGQSLHDTQGDAP